MSVEDQENVVDLIALRAELKAWENKFRDANGRRPGRADIKSDATIAAKYKLHDRVKARSRPPAPSGTPKKSTRPTESNQVLREKTGNAIAATPKKTPSKATHIACLPTVPSPVQEIEATPAHIRQGLGPTPQKDGLVLGIFDLLSGGTPSKSVGRGAENVDEVVAATPSKPTPSTSDQPFSRTPQSSGKRFFLDGFMGTPLKRKREDDIGTTSSSKRKFATPAFLRRIPLARIDEENNDTAPFRRRGLTRSLSSMIQGLRKQEDDRMDEEWDVLREMEEEQEGGKKPQKAPKVLVEDSQTVEMPLGPDQAQESSEESAAEGGAATRKPWKKKGLKRQTRRVIMRPNFHKAKKVEEVEHSEDEVVAETQLPETTCTAGADDDEFIDDLGSDEDGKTTTAKKPLKKPRPKEKPTEKESKKKKKGTIDPNAQSHANFRKLNIKNQNSKAKGKGRFGRR